MFNETDHTFKTHKSIRRRRKPCFFNKNFYQYKVAFNTIFPLGKMIALNETMGKYYLKGVPKLFKGPSLFPNKRYFCY